MRGLFAHADRDGNGALSLEEFQKITKDPIVGSWLGSMSIDVADADLVFSLLDDGDGSLTADELVREAARLKGPAKNVDIQNIIRRMSQQDALLRDIYASLRRTSNPTYSSALRSKSHSMHSGDSARSGPSSRQGSHSQRANFGSRAHSGVSAH